MKKLQILQRILDSGIVAIIRTDSSEKAIKLIEAIKAGGISTIEVTMSVPGAIDVIKEIANTYKDDIVLGVGSVLDSETARMAILAGAQYVVSPHLNPEVIKLCNRYQVPSMPGAMTVKEVVEAMEAGADIVKLFPGEVLGPKAVKAINAPVPQAPLMPTGGVSLENVQEWINNGAVAVGVGGSLTKGAKTGDYQLVTETARKFIEKIKEVRK
ncbi:MAG: 2-dehydro-3-deoxyphosphogluconate aldolase / (4S)-4-hydroxy-2-oxoglutarate aldolase [Clostridia bacterium]|jgi:2-dehydro-3-deoxyphosphogluconate aldolase/(4S)-4-hydroxy-2-oxoglutarate aldolase|nr:2-dehydro-3-deoxyphosphogluconate aldolase / (4S)-4-hydroxy-2-oxoglutarate aldolase [Clostridia bacterium]MDN5323140.1 2-dehydro-3-deoxyphosphogluconate aldolase / (4S)-4-hydroxy-2-oxoglutarate aldolase [Clostridia bacterium]